MDQSITLIPNGFRGGSNDSHELPSDRSTTCHVLKTFQHIQAKSL